MIFLFKQVIFRWTMLVFRGVELSEIAVSDASLWGEKWPNAGGELKAELDDRRRFEDGFFSGEVTESFF